MCGVSLCVCGLCVCVWGLCVWCVHVWCVCVSHHACQGQQCGLDLGHVATLKQVVGLKDVVGFQTVHGDGFDEVGQVLQLQPAHNIIITQHHHINNANTSPNQPLRAQTIAER